MSSSLSSAISPSPQQILARLRGILQKDRDARFIGIRCRPDWSGAALQLDSQEIPVVPCASPLALREALVQHDESKTPVVLLIDRDESELGLDVLARLAKRRLFNLDPWALVLELFRAREWDQMLSKKRWLAEALLEASGREGYPPVPSGVLDSDTVWRHILQRRYFFREATPDLQEILSWTRDSPGSHRFASEPLEHQAELASRLALSAGPAAIPVLDCVAQNKARDALATGLVLRLFFVPDQGQDLSLREAWVRMEERLLRGRNLDSRVAGDWAEAAEAYVRRSLSGSAGRPGVNPVLERAEEVVKLLGLRPQADRSAILQSGLELRLERWGERLSEALRQRPAAPSEALDETAAAVLDHELVRLGEGRSRPIHMALRLLRWLHQKEGENLANAAGSLLAAARDYYEEGGLVDWARASLWDEGAAPVLRQAYATLAERCASLREAEDRRFGELISSWAATSEDFQEALPIEKVLDRVVAPLAKDGPVLLVVLDGMSVAVFRELEEDLIRRGWNAIVPAQTKISPVIAAFPTITAVCRTSLLCGALRQGVDSDELSGFEAHPALREASPKRKPALFHKGRLLDRGASGLSEEVIQALDDASVQVVGVVVNAVDDHLNKGDQVRVAWRVDAITPLDALLARARISGRRVILTSDHGHVVERGSKYQSHEGAGERWRIDDGREEPGEVLLRGPRVVGAKNSKIKIRAPWSENLRYSSNPHHGYHGGAAPAEVVVPLGVFSAATTPAGWSESLLSRPSWWTGLEQPLEIISPRVAPSPSRAGPLFQGLPEPEARAGARAPEWVEKLLLAPAYESQRKRVARAAPDADLVRRVLTALAERGGKLTAEALAARVAIPPFRVNSTISVFRRLLNLDGYEVLSFDESSQTLALDQELLCTQFELEP